MAIGHVELNTAMTSIQDYTSMKHNEEQRSSVQQIQFQNHFDKELSKDIKQVMKTNQLEYQNKTEYQNKKFDAREKGSNQYTGDGGRKRRQNHQRKEEKTGVRTGFDVKV